MTSILIQFEEPEQTIQSKASLFSHFKPFTDKESFELVDLLTSDLTSESFEDKGLDDDDLVQMSPKSPNKHLDLSHYENSSPRSRLESYSIDRKRNRSIELPKLSIDKHYDFVKFKVFVRASAKVIIYFFPPRDER